MRGIAARIAASNISAGRIAAGHTIASRLTAAGAALLRLPLAAKIAGANAMLLVGLVAALWSVRGPTAGAWPAVTIAALALAGGAVVDIALVSLALRPLHDLETAARRVSSGDLAARVPRSLVADRDLSRVGGTLNALLDELTADRARMRALAAEVIRTGDRERAALARELHDSTAQALAALVYQLAAAERTSGDAALAAQLGAIRTAATGILEDVRLLSHTVYPRMLDDLGLVSALRHLARTAQEHRGARVVLEVTPDAVEAATRASADVAAVLYRVAQEATANALRHARAAHVTIRLETTLAGTPPATAAPRLELRIVDDGSGFDLADAERRRPGMGLFTMRERVSLVQGEFAVRTARGGGTTVSARVPSLAAASTGAPPERSTSRQERSA